MSRNVLGFMYQQKIRKTYRNRIMIDKVLKVIPNTLRTHLRISLLKNEIGLYQTDLSLGENENRDQNTLLKIVVCLSYILST